MERPEMAFRRDSASPYPPRRSFSYCKLLAQLASTDHRPSPIAVLGSLHEAFCSWPFEIASLHLRSLLFCQRLEPAMQLIPFSTAQGLSCLDLLWPATVAPHPNPHIPSWFGSGRGVTTAQRICEVYDSSRAAERPEDSVSARDEEFVPTITKKASQLQGR